jgi:hypothetical protein
MKYSALGIIGILAAIGLCLAAGSEHQASPPAPAASEDGLVFIFRRGAGPRRRLSNISMRRSRVSMCSVFILRRRGWPRH